MSMPLIAGPADADLPALIDSGYVMPRYYETAQGNRLSWATAFVGKAATIQSRNELCVALFARELTHEYGSELQTILNEYRISFRSVVNGDQAASRSKMIGFGDRVPTLAISADMKLEIFRDQSRTWTWNMLRDIDALSISVPCCHVVIADRDAASLVQRTRASERFGTIVSSNVEELPTLLEDLISTNINCESEPSDWTSVAPGNGYTITPLEPLLDVPEGVTIQLLSRDGEKISAP